MTGAERSSACRTTFRRKLTTLLESSSRMVTLQTLSAMFLPHPHMKQQTQAAVMRNRGRRGDHWWLIPYVAGISEDIRCICRKLNIRVIFKSGRTLYSMLNKVKDTLPFGKQFNVVYHIPCSCGQVYIVETRRRLEMKMKEHQGACERGMTKKSAVVEYVWENHQPIDWEETTVLLVKLTCFILASF